MSLYSLSRSGCLGAQPSALPTLAPSHSQPPTYTATSSGGAAYTTESGILSMTSGSASNNVAGSTGGGFSLGMAGLLSLAANGAVPLVAANNTAGQSGGMIAILDSSASVEAFRGVDVVAN